MPGQTEDQRPWVPYLNVEAIQHFQSHPISLGPRGPVYSTKLGRLTNHSITSRQDAVDYPIKQDSIGE